MIAHISQRGLGRCDAAIDCRKPAVVIAGPNGAGKTTLLRAIQIAVFGYVPELGQRGTGVIARGNEVEVKLILSNGTTIRRVFDTSNGAWRSLVFEVTPARGERTNAEKQTRVDREIAARAAHFNARDFMASTPSAKASMLMMDLRGSDARFGFDDLLAVISVPADEAKEMEAAWRSDATPMENARTIGTMIDGWLAHYRIQRKTLDADLRSAADTTAKVPAPAETVSEIEGHIADLEAQRDVEIRAQGEATAAARARQSSETALRALREEAGTHQARIGVAERDLESLKTKMAQIQSLTVESCSAAEAASCCRNEAEQVLRDAMKAVATSPEAVTPLPAEVYESIGLMAIADTIDGSPTRDGVARAIAYRGRLQAIAAEMDRIAGLEKIVNDARAEAARTADRNDELVAEGTRYGKAIRDAENALARTRSDYDRLLKRIEDLSMQDAATSQTPAFDPEKLKAIDAGLTTWRARLTSRRAHATANARVAELRAKVGKSDETIQRLVRLRDDFRGVMGATCHQIFAPVISVANALVRKISLGTMGLAMEPADGGVAFFGLILGENGMDHRVPLEALSSGQQAVISLALAIARTKAGTAGTTRFCMIDAGACDSAFRLELVKLLGSARASEITDGIQVFVEVVKTMNDGDGLNPEGSDLVQVSYLTGQS